MARQSGLSLGEAQLMSLLVYAGAAQFVAIGLWSPPLSVANIVLTSSIVNLRYVLMGAALQPWLSRISRLRAYGSLFFMSDESWALTMQASASGKADGAFLLGSSLGQFTSWGTATFLGYALGSVVSNPSKWGLDFVATIIFASLLVAMWKGKGDLIPWLSTALVAVVCSWWLPGKWYVLIGGLTGSLIGALRSEQ